MINRCFLLGILFTIYLSGCSVDNGVVDPYEQGLAYDPSQTALIPAGPFVMGSDSWSNTERPPHTVHLDVYRIDKYEVTNDQYAFYLRVIENLEGHLCIGSSQPDYISCKNSCSNAKDFTPCTPNPPDKINVRNARAVALWESVSFTI